MTALPPTNVVEQVSAMPVEMARRPVRNNMLPLNGFIRIEMGRYWVGEDMYHSPCHIECCWWLYIQHSRRRRALRQRGSRRPVGSATCVCKMFDWSHWRPANHQKRSESAPQLRVLPTDASPTGYAVDNVWRVGVHICSSLRWYPCSLQRQEGWQRSRGLGLLDGATILQKTVAASLKRPRSGKAVGK